MIKCLIMLVLGIYMICVKKWFLGENEMKRKNFLRMIFLTISLCMFFYNTSLAEPSTWAKNSIDALKEQRMLTESLAEDDKFQQDITREEFADLAVRLYAKAKGMAVEDIQGEAPFTDTDNPMVARAYSLGIVSGLSATEFAPDKKITRQEIAIMLLKELEALEVDTTVYERATFDDMDQVAPWAINGIHFCAQEGIMNGMGNNKVAPLSNTTKEQAMVLIHAIAQKYGWIEIATKDMPIEGKEGYTLLTTGYWVPKETKVLITSNAETKLHLRLTAQDLNREKDMPEKIDQLFQILQVNDVPEEIITLFRQKIEDAWVEGYNAPKMTVPIVKVLDDGTRIELLCNMDVRVSIYTPFLNMEDEPVNMEEYRELSTGYKVPKKTNLFISTDASRGTKLEMRMFRPADTEDMLTQIHEIFQILKVNNISEDIIKEIDENLSAQWNHTENRPGTVEITYKELPNGDKLVYSTAGYVQVKIFTY